MAFKKIAALDVDIIDGELLEKRKRVFVNPSKVTFVGLETHRFITGCCGGLKDVEAYFIKEGIRYYGIIGYTNDDAANMLVSFDGDSTTEEIVGSRPK